MKITETLKPEELTGRPNCELCGDPMPEGEEMFKMHGYSGDCPKPPLKDQAALADAKQAGAPEYVDSESDERVVNNVMRHEYRVLGDQEKSDMKTIKDLGRNFHEHIQNMINQSGTGSRELSLAQTKIEEAVMWAVKHITK